MSDVVCAQPEQFAEWERRFEAIVTVLRLQDILIPDRGNPSVVAPGDGSSRRLGHYEHCIVALAKALFESGIITQSELALKMADVEMRIVCAPSFTPDGLGE
ncbi:hypothetical protein [Rhizobium sp. LCM 4573]|uniref:hypothetical protein n=1 Tax=Rhizobium sp. LCM 4573 TaxID=1848291 RepID=UPI0008DB2E7B|nr:hypothetical protein [Rhizobium sp. LCM 4573]OHV82580.1 hypothetical protein LCM4573_16400 [Rhizobium sp. LCM 4573]